MLSVLSRFDYRRNSSYRRGGRKRSLANSPSDDEVLVIYGPNMLDCHVGHDALDVLYMNSVLYISRFLAFERATEASFKWEGIIELR